MKQIADFLKAHSNIISIEVMSVKGSAPRERGAFLLVSDTASTGTIGGGRLEFDAIDMARQMLASNQTKAELKVALGPDINQCCGGHVVLQLIKLDDIQRQTMNASTVQTIHNMPDVLLFGSGHVGRALALALAPLPFRVSLIDPRPHALLPAIRGVNSLALPMPEQAVREARPGASYVVMTHEHSLDFLIANEALNRRDAAYVGLIGSKTKKALFRSQYLANGGTLADFAKLTLPIGANPTGDKRPEVIAAFVATELCIRLLAPKRQGG